MPLYFQWDARKAVGNRRKDGVAFEEAVTVFGDPLARIFEDEEHSVEERREIMMGHSVNGRLLVISFTGRAEHVIRIISARLATRRERRDYEEDEGFRPPPQ